MSEMITVCHSLNNNTRMGLFISLFKYISFDQSDPPRIASNFRHLLSCGTIEHQMLFIFLLLLFRNIKLD